jgi:hypothetical protein
MRSVYSDFRCIVMHVWSNDICAVGNLHCLCAYIHTGIHTCCSDDVLSLDASILYVCTCMHVCIPTHIFYSDGGNAVGSLSLHTHTHPSIHTYIQAYIHTYIHAYIHEQIRYIHTYIHTYMNEYVRLVRWRECLAELLDRSHQKATRQVHGLEPRTQISRKSRCEPLTQDLRKSRCEPLTQDVRKSRCEPLTQVLRKSRCEPLTQDVRKSRCEPLTQDLRKSRCEPLTQDLRKICVMCFRERTHSCR